ncbi:DUF4019 domain-containing protein [Xanthomonas melonis]|uniref:DUF4019 domain-containing protein n=1 Tax=Xanthomonas melonis TaxID=56456 RepID=A0A2S7DFQ0_9XANT|nr:DUF4019 domain-containing protein [Xanthomonas melonis]MCC4599526.1 DUF4019 domain-containing protein [Xanthomonas melonis]PPU72636.1 hypothetical protein XmelCFBP4644_11465 [Xanthomonas melonis]
MRRPRLLVALLFAPALVFAQQPQPSNRAAAAVAQPAPAAQKPAAAALNPAQQAQVAKQDIEMTQAALRVAQMVDTNKAATVWDGASRVAKSAVKRDAFVSQLAGERARLGALVGRGQSSVTRVKYGPGAQVPEGLYVNVSFPTRFANAQQPVRELVSFRLDEDKTWRVAGYSLRTAAK